MRRLMIAICVMGLLVPTMVPAVAYAQERIEVAQQAKKRTLWDMFFGPDEEVQVQQQRQQTQRRSSSSSSSTPRQASLPPPVPDVEKSADATRLAVFGDSLAVDLAKAMQRFYAEDPNLVIIGQGVGSSGFVRDDFFDWNAALDQAITADTFDIAVVIMGINDRQNLRVDGVSAKPLTNEWKVAYSARLTAFLQRLRAGNKPTIWVELPPMKASSYSAAMTEISALQRLVAFAGGAEFVDAYQRFADENGGYVSAGPDLNGQTVQMRKSDGIHFSSAGSDKLAFFINQSLKRFYRGGAISIAVSDPLEGTEAQAMARLPLQGLGQIRLLEVAGAVVALRANTARSGQLLLTDPAAVVSTGFSLDQLVRAPAGRADAFGVGIEPGADDEPGATP